MDKPHIHVLLVEDYLADVILIEAALTQVTHIVFHVTTAEQLSQGLDAIAAQHFDVILLDLGLPDSQGLTTFIHLHTQAPAIPVVVLSGMEDEALATEAVYAGAQDYLVKGQAGSELLARSIRYAIERHRFQEQLRTSEQYFRALIEHSTNAVATLTADGTILYKSPAALHILGYRAEEMIGQNAFTFLHPDDMPASRNLFNYLQQQPQQPLSCEIRYCHKDGTWCWLEVTGTNLLDVPGVRAIVVNYRDITARKHAEAALRQLNETLELRIAERTADLRTVNTELARAARLKDEFLATMSHELRTPLNAILGRTELLWGGVYGSLTPKQLEALHSIDVSGRHLLTLINEILDLSRIEAGKLDIQIEPVTLTIICQMSLHMVTESAVAKQITLHTALDPQVTTIFADERRLTQILVNLLTNAIKFTPNGGAVGLEVQGNPQQQTVTFSIWDTGIGIAKEDLPHLFQPFTQIDGGLNRQHGGTGLGLTLVHRLVLAHQGSVTVTSQPGQGSRFSITLPWHTALAETQTQSTEATPDVRRPILLVEDNVDQSQMIADYLQAHGYMVHTASSGIEALAIAQEKPPAVVIMDIQLPGIDGIETTRRMRAHAPLQAIPIIALTALALPGDRERCLAAGADSYLAKPVSLHTLLALIQTYLARR